MDEIRNTARAPLLRVLCEGAGATNAGSCEATPPDREMKSFPIPHSPVPVRLRREDRNGNCSIAIARAIPPVSASPDWRGAPGFELTASPPTLAENARMGAPQWERCMQRVGHPPSLLMPGRVGEGVQSKMN